MRRTFEVRLRRDELAVAYGSAPRREQAALLERLGPLRAPFARFFDAEERRTPLNAAEIVEAFDRCTRETATDEVLALLHLLQPGGAHVGAADVLRLCEHLRARTAAAARLAGSLLPHDDAFGSGGDFQKTAHATTHAAMVAAPMVRTCKTGTMEVTARHGSQQAAAAYGYVQDGLDAARLNEQLRRHGFAYVPLSQLGFPYSATLRAARKQLWIEASQEVQRSARELGSWCRGVRESRVPIDIFKVVSPNAHVLAPLHHTTGVPHLSMIPYVMAIYLARGTCGCIVHAYDGIDELSNATSLGGGEPNNVVVRFARDEVTIAEMAPEDAGFARADIAEIAEADDATGDAERFRRVLDGSDRGARRDFLLLNAAVLLAAAGKTSGATLAGELRSGAQEIARSIDSGFARRNLEALVACR